MSKAARDRIELAFQRLAERPGFTSRADQRQLSDLIGDCLDSGQSGAFEAPTGLGKSLACLIPAIAHAHEGRRTVIATYTNVLAEQYWFKDLPLALSLFDETPPGHELLMGKSRYACKVSMEELQVNATTRTMLDRFGSSAKLGIETEFRNMTGVGGSGMRAVWGKSTVPPVCAGRFCPLYEDCFYFSARKRAEKAPIVITNHAVVLQHAILMSTTDGESGLYGKPDFLVLDEAHDFVNAAAGALEFELSDSKLNVIASMASKLISGINFLAESTPEYGVWKRAERDFQLELDRVREGLYRFGQGVQRAGILEINPDELKDHPAVLQAQAEAQKDKVYDVSEAAADTVQNLIRITEHLFEEWKEQERFSTERLRDARESAHNYIRFLTEFVIQCRLLMHPQDESVTFLRTAGEAAVRQEPIVFSTPLRTLVFEKTPTVALSATLAIDGQFDYFCRSTGFEPVFSEVLSSPFDFSTQAAIYLPEAGAVPDPSIARRDGTEPEYYDALAREIGAIIDLAQGRTLALFHSRKEMNAVFERVAIPSHLQLHVQTGSAAGVGDRFRNEISSSLFAVRSFWTGFDAPGETLSVVILVRVPFEVPVDPPQIARHAYLRSKGMDPFAEQTLPAAKMMIRQGFGRLIRQSDDKGVIALLDPRLTSKNYGEAILGNLPQGIRTFRDAGDAIGWVGL